jgi:hypothetical protein
VKRTNPRILTINGGSSTIKFALFCYQVKKWIGAFAGALGGLDTLVFAGGIGENAPLVRTRICEGLGFLGIDLEDKRNAANDGVISTTAGGVRVRVIRTDEEQMIARSVWLVLTRTNAAFQTDPGQKTSLDRRGRVTPHGEAAPAVQDTIVSSCADRAESDLSKSCRLGANSEQERSARSERNASC